MTVATLLLLVLRSAKKTQYRSVADFKNGQYLEMTKEYLIHSFLA